MIYTRFYRYPDGAPLLRVATLYLREQDEEWLTESRRMLLGSLSEFSADAISPASTKFIA